MSDEETREGAAETTGDSPAALPHVSTEAGSSEAASSEASEGVAEAAAVGASAGEGTHEPVQGEPVEHAAFAATVLGDTLPSAVRAAIAASGSGAAVAHVGSGHGGDGHGHDDHGDEHFSHPLSMTILGGVLGALIVLTVLTVAVTSIDLGSQGNFIVAMIIATIKAALVMGYFMHLVWDSKFNVLVFLSSFLFVLLFLSMALLDRGEYQLGIDTFEADQKATAK